MEDGPIVVSHSRIGTFASCGEKYRRRYVAGERGPPALPLVFGSTFHACAAMVNRRGGRASPLELERIVDEKWAEAGAELALLKTADPNLDLKGERALLGKLLQGWHDAPGRLPPREAEVERVVPLVDPRTGEAVPLTFLKFIMDGLYSDTPPAGCILELKTSDRLWSRERALTEDQPGVYLLGMWPGGVRQLDCIYEVVVKTIPPRVQRIRLTVARRDAEEAFDKITNSLRGIRARSFQKNRGLACAWCDYKSACLGIAERWNNARMEL